MHNDMHHTGTANGEPMPLEALAAMVANGFSGVDEKIETLRTEMRTRFDKIENLLIAEHRQRIEKLER
jgi:hypothetical protein